MAILFESGKNIFTIHTDNSTYQMRWINMVSAAPVLWKKNGRDNGLSADLCGPGILGKPI